MPVFDLTLDVHKRTGGIPQQVVVRAGDVETQTIRAELIDDGATYEPSGASARLDVMHADGTWARCAASVVGSQATCVLPSEAVSSPGQCRMAHFVLTYADGRAESTQGFQLLVLRSVDGSGERAGDYDTRMDALMREWEAFEEQARRQDAERSESMSQATKAAQEAAEAARRAAEAAGGMTGVVSQLRYGTRSDGSTGPVLTIIEEA